MNKLYLVDTENISFVPQNSSEAIILFNRLKNRNLIHWDYLPETFQKLAVALDPAEHDRFCEWICNPTELKPGAPGYFAELCEEKCQGKSPKSPEDSEVSDLTAQLRSNHFCTESDNEKMSNAPSKGTEQRQPQLSPDSPRL